MEGIQGAAFIAGIVIGCVAVGGACFVWIRHRVFGMGGSVLSVVGVALLGLSIWSGISIQIDREGLRAEFTRLQEQVDAVVDANETVVQEVSKALDIAEAGRNELIVLTRALQRQQVLPPGTLEEIRTSMQATPAIDREALAQSADRLKTIRSSRPVVE